MNLEPGKKIYFASDQHFGAPNPAESKKRETHFIQWLDEIKNDCQILYLVGDLFDFWFEYKTVAPRGHVRLLGKLAELSDSGIKIHFFTGNHDMWVFDYLPEEIGMELHHEPIEKEYNGKQFYIAHGDGLGPGDHGYKFIKKVFRNKLCQWLFARLHPNFGIGLANYFSRSSRAATGDNDKTYLGEENEWLAIYAKEKLQEKHYDYFVFGHRHLPLDLTVGENSRYINLGDWISDFTYAIFDGSKLTLEEYPL
ncbi:UDP-2,3-diacylglucosamine diphosphatase [Salibacter sp.]|uniref:UDP-2,3-diacylglucosamine diphosphatase n=1 Tax=Salibacter sp. TaxID=2010995 RepID=UPI00286FBD2D|nr:UDP-2,3-diacylglucosamine diphosphatase [Salibacter sp.]MDR9397639.1 UDP-2,3-diacylglucosamine diphosphatase [Salibacter sp.]MDR9486793.1 UDP-2,3-diacylglucosamine diphosphatase [Salibacter sp.]